MHECLDLKSLNINKVVIFLLNSLTCEGDYQVRLSHEFVSWKLLSCRLFNQDAAMNIRKDVAILV